MILYVHYVYIYIYTYIYIYGKAKHVPKHEPLVSIAGYVLHLLRLLRRLVLVTGCRRTSARLSQHLHILTISIYYIYIIYKYDIWIYMDI